MPPSSNEELLYFDNPNKNVFLMDRDVELLKKLGSLILDHYPRYQVLASDNWDDLEDELIKEKPTLFILELSDENHEKFFEFVRGIRTHKILNEVPIMAMATRQILEKYSHDINNLDVEIVPKAVRIPFFLGVLQSCINKTSSMQVDLIELKPGELLFREAELADCIFITKEGKFEVYQVLEGDEYILGTLGPNEVVGEMALLKGSARSASVRSVTQTKVLKLKIGNVEDYLEAQPFWLNMILEALVQRLKKTNEKLIESRQS